MTESPRPGDPLHQEGNSKPASSFVVDREIPFGKLTATTTQIVFKMIFEAALGVLYNTGDQQVSEPGFSLGQRRFAQEMVQK